MPYSDGTFGLEDGSDRFVAMMANTAQKATIQIQAKFLRNNEALAQTGATLGIGRMLEDLGRETHGGDGRRRSGWRERDLKRAIGAAQKAGLIAYRVEIAPDGTISVVVGNHVELPED